MIRHHLLAFSVLGGLTTLAVAAPPKAAPETRYWMSAETVSGMASGAPDGQARRLQLQLGSPRSVSAPAAEHLPPATLKAGPSLPLATPRSGSGSGSRSPRTHADTAMPKTRLLLYWGCGEKAGPGQPLVLELATPAAGKLMAGLSPGDVAMKPPSAYSHATYGEWPNSDGRKDVPATGSLIGEHQVRGNYTPDIRFALTAANDFLAPLTPRSSRLASGAVQLEWPSIPNARAYFASVMGARADGTMLLWSSSAVKVAGMLMPEYLTPADQSRLLASKVLMTPETTRCAVPAEVAQGTDGAAFQMTAFGAEANFRSGPNQPGWAVKVRTRSTHMGLLGMPGPDPQAATAETQPAPAEPRPSRKRQILRGLGSLIGGTY